MFTDASFAGDLRDSKSTSGVYLVIMGPNTFVPVSWFVKKQGAVSHSSSEAEVIVLDAAVRMEGMPPLSFWEAVLNALHPEVVTDRREPTPCTPKLDLIHQILLIVDSVLVLYLPPQASRTAALWRIMRPSSK